MKEIPDIRALFKPVQPTVKNTGGLVSYSEVFPDIRLAKYIYCYWQLKTNELLSKPFFYRVVADSCIDILFELNNPDDNYIMGFSTAYTEFPLEKSFNYIGIRFLPAAFPLLYKTDVSELTNRFENLKLVLPHLSEKISMLISPKLSFEEIIRLLNDFFLMTITASEFDIDNRFFNAVNIILKSQGTINTETELDTGLSPRQLRRVFDYYIGDSPKVFGKVIRFQNILNAKPSAESLVKNKLFYDFGYYDQSHFIKEFKTFYGITPTKA